MPDWINDSLYLVLALILVILNGFFVAAEFALVKVRGSQLEEMVRRGWPFAKTARWLGIRLDASLSACQLGITLTSLGLGWVGEPAFSRLVAPVLHWCGITSEAVIHTVGFIVAFALITALHLVIGEQAPKIFAIRHPDKMVRWCAFPLKFFYVIFYPFLIALNAATSAVLRLVGIRGETGHDSPHSEDEIRALMLNAHIHGDLTQAEHRLLNAVFEFDDMICRRVMVPRHGVVFLDADAPSDVTLDIIRRTKHSRYPICKGSLDDVIGILHVKDVIDVLDKTQIDVRKLKRPSRLIPESMPISKLLRQFQATHQLMAIVVDEHGTNVGIVTLENVLEQIVGPVDDEFDHDTPDIFPCGPGQHIVQGSAPVEDVGQELDIELFDQEYDQDIDTISGLLVMRMGRILEVGDRVEFPGAVAEVTEVIGARATQIKFTRADHDPEVGPSDDHASQPDDDADESP